MGNRANAQRPFRLMRPLARPGTPSRSRFCGAPRAPPPGTVIPARVANHNAISRYWRSRAAATHNLNPWR